MTASIPPATVAKINGSHPDGTRHQAKIDIALPLLGNGLPPDAVVATLRDKFPAATLAEIEGVVSWCQSRNPTPTEYRAPLRGERPVARFVAPNKKSSATALSLNPVGDLVGNVTAPEEDWILMSPVKIPENPSEHAAVLIENLYAEADFLCGLCDHGINPQNSRVFPKGAGYTRSRKVWLDRIRDKGMLVSDAGCWWRMNPVKAKGSGEGGAPCDADVTSFRYALVEHDKLPIDTQLAVLALFRKYGLPLAAIIRTGGKSVHAWVRLEATDEKDYAAKIEQLLSITQPLGFDHNKNPSRLARIPGVQRKLGAAGDGWQRLLYLNPDPGPFDFQKFKNSFPIEGMVRGDELIERVREWMKPRRSAFTMQVLGGKTPEDGIYFRPAEVTLWTGTTSHGKSTLLKQCMMELVCEKVPFFVASLEHKAEDICEGLARAANQRIPTADEVVKFLNVCGHYVHFLDEVGEIAAVELMDKMRRCFHQTNAQHFFIDSLMRISGLEEDYPAQTAFMNDLQAFVKDTKAHVHLVTHPRKIDETQRARKMDVKGSNNIANNADNILSVRRNVQKDEVTESGKPAGGLHDAEVSVEKQRATGWQGVTRLIFNAEAKTFSRYKPDAKPERRNYHE